MKEVLSNWGYYGFKFYVSNYVLFLILFNVFSMQSNQWYICNILITADNQLRLYIFWHNDTYLFLLTIIIYDDKWSTKTFPGINPICLGTPWDGACLEPQEKEQYSFMFINQSSKIYQTLSRNEPSGPWLPLVRLLSRTPTIGKIFCDVYKTITNNPPKIVKLDELPLIQSIYLLQQVKSQKLAPSPRPSTNLWRKKIRMCCLDTAHWQFSITPEDRF